MTGGLICKLREDNIDEYNSRQLADEIRTLVANCQNGDKQPVYGKYRIMKSILTFAD